MKTALTILLDKLPNRSLLSPKELEYVLSAMKAYAEQAIIKCAEDAEQINTAPMMSYEAHYIIDKQSILNVKDQLL